MNFLAWAEPQNQLQDHKALFVLLAQFNLHQKFLGQKVSLAFLCR